MESLTVAGARVPALPARARRARRGDRAARAAVSPAALRLGRGRLQRVLPFVPPAAAARPGPVPRPGEALRIVPRLRAALAGAQLRAPRPTDEQAWTMGSRLVPPSAPDRGGCAIPRCRPRAVPRRRALPRLDAADRTGPPLPRAEVLPAARSRRRSPQPRRRRASRPAGSPGLVERLRAGLEPVERRLEVLRDRRNGPSAKRGSWKPSSPARTDPPRPPETLRLRLEAANRRMAAAMAPDGPGAPRPDQPRGGRGRSACPRAPSTAACSG